VLQEFDQLLANLATQIPRRRSVVGAHERAQLDGGFLAVADLEADDLAVPQFGLSDDFDELVADDIDRGSVIDVEKYGADQLAAGSGPVLKWFLDEVAERNDQPPQIPQLDHDVAERDLLDIAGLVLDDDGIVDANGLRHSKLHAGKEVAQQWPCREPGDDAGDACRSEQRDPKLPDGIEGHQGKTDGDEHNHNFQHALQHTDLSDMFARQQVVVDVELETHEVQVGCNVQHGQRGPAEQADRGQPKKPPEYFGGVCVERGRRQGDR
jgi:hypothetical protein